jgi:hypothetical protein
MGDEAASQPDPRLERRQKASEGCLRFLIANQTGVGLRAAAQPDRV